MKETTNDLRPHFILSQTEKSEKFCNPKGGGGKKELPQLDRNIHGRILLKQLNSLKKSLAKVKKLQKKEGMEIGLQIKFQSQPNIELAVNRLAVEKKHIELINVKREKDNPYTFATIFVPEDGFAHFLKRINEYMKDDRPKGGPKHESLFATIEEICPVTFDDLWMDDINKLPQSDDQNIWWEVWLPVRHNREEVVKKFRSIATKLGFEFPSGELYLLERTVLIMQGSKKQLLTSPLLLNNIAELRRARGTVEYFDSLPPYKQRESVDELLNRIEFSGDSQEDSPYVCILDTGVNNAHPLIKSALHDDDLYSIFSNEDLSDDDGHGTEMAGAALFGNLDDLLNSTLPIRVSHRLESVKLIKKDGRNEGENHGHLTVKAIDCTEDRMPKHQRLFSMALTTGNCKKGHPSAWSAAIDMLSVNYENDLLVSSRLFIISGGNTKRDYSFHYPDSNSTDEIHDPAQAWNALTVGAFTEKIHITEEDTESYVSLAPFGGLSPFSTTSVTWDPSTWPIKPDVVFEGGNLAKDSLSTVTIHSLSLLTCHSKLQERLFTVTRGTSVATAQCARMAAQLWAEYPNLWPETIRGLIVHSAKWTQSMINVFKKGSTPKKEYENLIRHCGFGVPNLEQARWSAKNSLTLIVQAGIQPFERGAGSGITTRDMNIHSLPWPEHALEALGEREIEMKVTLSYFIEPSPGEKGFKERYQYESHGLRFEVRRPTETIKDFRQRINKLARKEDKTMSIATKVDPGWQLGSQLRHTGSIHSDIWRGSAVDLAKCGDIVVYPATGWWKELKRLKRYNRKTRYALLISILAPKIDIDLYSEIQNIVRASVSIVT